MIIAKLAYDFQDANLLDANREAVAAGADVFIWNDRLYAINRIQASVEADEAMVAATMLDLTNGATVQ